MQQLDRRDFLTILGTTAAGAYGVTAFSCDQKREAGQIAASQPDSISPSDLTWGKAPCRYCGTGCGVEVGVKDGAVMAVRGDVASPVNRGLLCVKGYHLPGMLYGKDRLLYPMRRGPDGKLSRISWDDALNLIAEKFKNALDTTGPDSIGVYGSGQWTIFDGYTALKWVKGGMKSNNLEPNARLCMASAVMGFVTQFQSDEPMGCYDDFEFGDDFILWGHNAAEMHPVLFSRMLERKRQSPGARIIDLATRRTPTSDYADMYVEFIPGSDLALANGILHLLCTKNKIDTAFIKENVVFKRGEEESTRSATDASAIRPSTTPLPTPRATPPMTTCSPSSTTTHPRPSAKSAASPWRRSKPSPTSTAINPAARSASGAWASTSTTAAPG